MEIIPFLAVVALVHSALYFTDQLLKSCMNVPYIYFLDNLGLVVRPLQIHWSTTAINRSVTKWASWRPRFFRAWFSVGVVVVCVLLLPSLLLLITGLANHLYPANQRSQPTLQPMVPGLNIPVEELPCYFFTLLFASVIHEAGHALAAVQEGVRINGFGFILLFVFPGAYVDVSTEEIQSITPFRQLKVLCAGVWHNIVLVVCALCVGLSLPYTLAPFYTHNNGLTVLDISQDSPARGVLGLEAGDTIRAVNRQPVVSVEVWRWSIVSTATKEQTGFCVPESVVHDYDETIHHVFEGADGSVQCCDGGSEAHLCFELKQDTHTDTGVAFMQPFSCLPARIAVSKSTKSCITSSSCPPDTHCLAPSLKNSSRLIQITRGRLKTSKEVPNGPNRPNGPQEHLMDPHKRDTDEDRETIEDVLYLGPPAYLYHTISVTGYISKHPYIPASIPGTLEVYADYMVKFSGALAVLNMVPVVYLDGYWISAAVIDRVFASRCDHLTRKVTHAILTFLGSLLLVLNVVLGVWVLL